jgi:hypothetical protein
MKWRKKLISTFIRSIVRPPPPACLRSARRLVPQAVHRADPTAPENKCFPRASPSHRARKRSPNPTAHADPARRHASPHASSPASPSLRRPPSSKLRSSPSSRRRCSSYQGARPFTSPGDSWSDGIPPQPVACAVDSEPRLLIWPSSTPSIQGKQQIHAGARPFTSPGDSWPARKKPDSSPPSSPSPGSAATTPPSRLSHTHIRSSASVFPSARHLYALRGAASTAPSEHLLPNPTPTCLACGGGPHQSIGRPPARPRWSGTCGEQRCGKRGGEGGKKKTVSPLCISRIDAASLPGRRLLRRRLQPFSPASPVPAVRGASDCWSRNNRPHRRPDDPVDITRRFRLHRYNTCQILIFTSPPPYELATRLVNRFFLDLHSLIGLCLPLAYFNISTSYFKLRAMCIVW